MQINLPNYFLGTTANEKNTKHLVMRALPSKILRTRSTMKKKGARILCASLKWKCQLKERTKMVIIGTWYRPKIGEAC